jgi:hypothetical protein
MQQQQQQQQQEEIVKQCVITATIVVSHDKSTFKQQQREHGSVHPEATATTFTTYNTASASTISACCASKQTTITHLQAGLWRAGQLHVNSQSPFLTAPAASTPATQSQLD